MTDAEDLHLLTGSGQWSKLDGRQNIPRISKKALMAKKQLV